MDKSWNADPELRMQTQAMYVTIKCAHVHTLVFSLSLPLSLPQQSLSSLHPPPGGGGGGGGGGKQIIHNDIQSKPLMRQALGLGKMWSHNMFTARPGVSFFLTFLSGLRQNGRS